MKEIPNLNQVKINAFIKNKSKKKISDGMVKGLLLEKTKTKVVWRLRYQFGGKDRNIKVGDYPDVSLSVTREQARKYKELLAQGIDPNEYKRKQLEKIKKEQSKKTFKKVAEEFLAHKKNEVSEKRFKSNYLRSFKHYILPNIGHKKVDEVKREDIIKIIKKIPSIKLPFATRTGSKTYIAKEVLGYIKKCLDYALNLNLIEYNPAYGIDVSLLLPKQEKSQMKAFIKENEVKELYQKIINYHNKPASKMMQFQALTALRNVGLYRLKWEYIDWEEKIITFPKNTYKGNEKEYILPLTSTLEEILKYFKTINGNYPYVFRAANIKEESLSNKLRKYYKDLNITGHTPHGWRSSFKSLATEKRAANFETIELQLNHNIGSSVNGAYFRTHLIDERRKLLEWWKEFLNS